MPLSTKQFSARGRRLIGQEMFKILDQARNIERQGHKVFHLELGNSCVPPPEEVIEATCQALRMRQVGYVSPAGHEELRKAIAERYTFRCQRSLSFNNIIVSPANFLISQFLDLVCNRGDRVVLFVPAFPTFLAAAQYIDVEIVPIELDRDSGFHLETRHLEAALAARPRAILVNSANNPTGAVYEQNILEWLATECEKRGIWLLSDETYGDLCYDRPFWSLAAVDAPRVVVLSSFSKSFGIPGFRTGYAIAHAQVAEKLALSCSTLISCLPPHTQLGCVAALDVADVYLPRVREYFSRMTAMGAAMLQGSQLFACHKPESGFYLFIDITATGVDDRTFCRILLEKSHTALTPGCSFGEKTGGFVRASVCGEESDVVEGLTRVIELGHELVRHAPSRRRESSSLRALHHVAAS